MKAQIGVDAQSGLVHLVTGTAANVTDIVQTHQLLRGEEQEVTADAGFQNVEKRAKIVAGAQGVEWHIAAKSGKVKSLAEGMIKELPLKLERVKAQVGARVKYPFHVLKNIFRHQKTRYRWLAKNTAQLHRLFALTNLFLARRPLRNPAKAWTNAKSTPKSRCQQKISHPQVCRSPISRGKVSRRSNHFKKSAMQTTPWFRGRFIQRFPSTRTLPHTRHRHSSPSHQANI